MTNESLISIEKKRNTGLPTALRSTVTKDRYTALTSEAFINQPSPQAVSLPPTKFVKNTSFAPLASKPFPRNGTGFPLVKNPSLQFENTTIS